MKKTYILIIAIALFLVTVPLTAGADTVDGGSCGNDVTWTLDDQGTLTISGNGYMTSHPWRIEDDLSSKLRIHKVIIENGVKNIVDGAFSECTNVTDAAIANSVTAIGAGAFQFCAFDSITIPGSVTRIDYNAFDGCASLTGITIPDSVTNMGRNIFNNCSALTEVSLPANITTIPDSIFFNCTSLGSITIPSGVTSIQIQAFYNCDSLTEIVIPESVTSLDVSVFEDCDNLAEVTILGNVETIEHNAFQGCSALTEITLPESLENLYEAAFKNCYSLQSVTIQGSLYFIGPDCFYNCFDLAEITLPACNVQAIEQLRNEGHGSILNITPHILIKTEKLEPTCTERGFEAYWTCRLCDRLFSDEAAQNEIDRPVYLDPHHILIHHEAQTATCTDIGWSEYDTCSRCDYTTYAEISPLGHNWGDPEYVWSGNNASVTATCVCSRDASHIMSETVGTVVYITSPTEETQGNAHYVSGVFEPDGWSAQTKDITIPALKNMSVLYLPDDLKTVGNSAFANLSCQAVIIPQSCRNIGARAFAGCTELIYVQMPAAIESYPANAFEGCSENLIIDRK